MEYQKIELVPLIDEPSRDILVGINGEIVITPRIASAVEQSGRLFPYVVRQITDNRIQSNVINDSDDLSSLLCEQMKQVRDELNVCLEGIRNARYERLLHAQNVTLNVRPVNHPYFVR